MMLKKCIQYIVISITALIFYSSPSFADEAKWSDISICRAATLTYFFLSNPPDYIFSRGDKHAFKSELGNIYHCYISGQKTVLSWINKSGEDMISNVTSYSIRGGVLVVTSDMSHKTFNISQAPWNPMPIVPVDGHRAKDLCHSEIESRVKRPATIIFLIKGFSSKIASNGDKIINQRYTIKGFFGVRSLFFSHCRISNDGSIEVELTKLERANGY